MAMPLGYSMAGALLSPQNLRGCFVSEALAGSSVLRACSIGPQSPIQAGLTAGAARVHRDPCQPHESSVGTDISVMPGHCQVVPLDLCQVNGRATLSPSVPRPLQPPCPSASCPDMAGGDVVTVLCGTSVRALPRAWQQFQGVSTDINPPRFGTPLCWGPAGAGLAQSKSLLSVFSQIRDLEDVAACLEKVLGEIKQLQDAEGAQLPTVSGGAAQRPGGFATPHPTHQGHIGASSLRMSSLATLWGHP